MGSVAELPAETRNQSDEIHEAITRRARELWELRGRVDGHAEEDWAQAEAEVMKAMAGASTPKKAFIAVKIGQFIYTGEYDARQSDVYRPGDLNRGEPTAIHFEGEKMFLRLKGGRELATRIVKRELV